MQGKIKKMYDTGGNQYVFPVTVSDAVYTDSDTTLTQKLSALDSQITNLQNPAPGTGGSTSTATYPNVITHGTVQFKLDPLNKTITWTNGEINSPYATYVLTSGSVVMSTWGIGTSQHAFICYNPTTSTFETKNSTDMSTYNGLILFASSYGKVYIPFYPKYLVQLIAPDMSNLNNVLYTKDNPEILGQYPIDIREMVLLGDSLSALDRWVYMLDQYFYIPKRTNLAASGTKMSTDTMLKATRAEITTTTQLTTILSGTNDCGWSIPVGTVQSIGSTYDTSTYAGAYQTCVENLYAKNPNMRIIIIVSPRAWYPAGSDTSNPTYEVTNTKLAPYQQVARDVAKTYGLPCFDTPNVMGVNDKNYSQWTVDNLHFNSFGYEKLGRRLAEFIKTNF